MIDQIYEGGNSENVSLIAGAPWYCPLSQIDKPDLIICNFIRQFPGSLKISSTAHSLLLNTPVELFDNRIGNGGDAYKAPCLRGSDFGFEGAYSLKEFIAMVINECDELFPFAVHDVLGFQQFLLDQPIGVRYFVMTDSCYKNGFTFFLKKEKGMKGGIEFCIDAVKQEFFQPDDPWIVLAKISKEKMKYIIT